METPSTSSIKSQPALGELQTHWSAPQNIEYTQPFTKDSKSANQEQ